MQYTVSHFSYAPHFQGPQFLTEVLESNILCDNLLIYILSVWYIEIISESLLRIIQLRQRRFSIKMHVQPTRLYFLFAFCARHVVTVKHQKLLFYSRIPPFCSH